MKIGILYICTGPYRIFWEGFYQSCEKHFFPHAEKNYFVFTDSSNLVGSQNINVYFKPSRGFPLDSLLRFDYFSEIKAEWLGCDYVYFFNSNMRFVLDITTEILPSDKQSGLVALLHPGRFNKSKYWHPYERRKDSCACILPWEGNGKYYMGALNGGTAGAYSALVETCRAQIQRDIDRNVIAVYHDESHLNKYLSCKNILELSPAFGYPEGWAFPFDPKIIIIDKVKHGGYSFEKISKSDYIGRFKRITKQAIQLIYSFFR